jgi:putative aldouronate transport system permease protein
LEANVEVVKTKNLKAKSKFQVNMAEWKNSFKKHKLLYLLLVPFITWYLLFQYKPMLGLLIAFQDYSVFKGIAGSEFVGFQNFLEFFGGDYFWRTFRNTLLIGIYGLVFAFPAPILLALLLNEVKNKFFRGSVQTLTYLPYFVSTVVVAGIIINFLSPSTGVINMFIEKLGFDRVYFLTQPEYFRTIYILTMEIWKTIGYTAIVYIAAIAGINPSLYEAATMDGASRVKQMLYITIPSILPTIMIMLILNIGNILSVGYEAIILLYQPSTYETADVISTYVYRAGLQNGQYDIATVADLFNAVVGLILVLGANKLSKKLTSNGLW